jgi:hypothetical protein
LPSTAARRRSARFEQRFSSVLMANDYVAVYRSLLERPSVSERETTVPMPRPVLEKSLMDRVLTAVERTAPPKRML